jgi:hypothetical protein
MHAAIYDAVNAIDGTHQPYLVRLGASHFASQEAAAAAAAHEVLVKLYPSFQATLDAQLQQALAQLPSRGKADGISIGNTVADCNQGLNGRVDGISRPRRLLRRRRFGTPGLRGGPRIALRVVSLDGDLCLLGAYVTWRHGD